MGHRIGRDCKLYRNTGSYGSPSWNEIPLVRDLTTNLETQTVEAGCRTDGLWEPEAVVGLSMGVDFDLRHDPADADYQAIATAYFAASTIEFLILDGAVGTGGNSGVRATCMIQKFSQPQQRKDIVVNQVTIKPAPNDNSPPTRYTT